MKDRYVRFEVTQTNAFNCILQIPETVVNEGHDAIVKYVAKEVHDWSNDRPNSIFATSPIMLKTKVDMDSINLQEDDDEEDI